MTEADTPIMPSDAADLEPVPRIVTIGSFDGVHLGHRHLLRGTVARGRSRAMATLAVTFEPLPPAVLRPDRFPGRICPVEEKLAHLAASGIDRIVTLPFSLAVAGQSPDEFMEGIRTQTRLQELWVGEAFALGKNRSGDVVRLSEIGRRLGFEVVAVPRFSVGGEIVSSSAIRTAILDGDVATAGRLLGRPVRVAGEVIHGAHFGRTIGFPTANVRPAPDQVPLADGIYASLAWLPDEPLPSPAMTYVGTRPTINTGDRLVETHLLDFDGDLYGRVLAVDLVERLRPDATFDGVAAMVAQLRRDEQDARAVLAGLGTTVLPQTRPD